jgi:hypothetical protein
MTKRPSRVIATAWVMTTLFFGGAAAQATALPGFHAPTRAFANSETGFAVSRPGGDLTALELRLGFALDEADLALRGGYLDRRGSADGDWVAGLEGRIPVLGGSLESRLDGALILGVGASRTAAARRSCPSDCRSAAASRWAAMRSCSRRTHSPR